MERDRDDVVDMRVLQADQAAVATVVTARATTISSAEVQAMAHEIETLRRQVERLQRELADARAAVQASEASQLGRTLLVYLLDVICALFCPQRAQTLIVDVQGGVLKEAKEAHGGVGPLQMVLERPSLNRAIGGQASRVMTHYESAMWLPIMHGSGVAAILCLRRPSSDPFSIQEQELGEVLGPLVISALQAGHRTFDLHEDHEALGSLDSTLGACVRRAGGQITAMADDAEQIAQALDLRREERVLVRLGAILHDIGTVDLAEDLLYKDGSLNTDEVAKIREHTVFGAEIIRQVPGMGALIPLVLHHHERWDGTGYPSGLAGGTIPLGARIIAVVDAFHAMTSPRTYRPTRSVEEALADLQRCAGGQFDPTVVERFVRRVRPAS